MSSAYIRIPPRPMLFAQWTWILTARPIARYYLANDETLTRRALEIPEFLGVHVETYRTAVIFQIIHRLRMLEVGDELHHSGWNICSSCHDSSGKRRNILVLPCLMSDRVYLVDTCDDKAPKIKKVRMPDVSCFTGELCVICSLRGYK